DESRPAWPMIVLRTPKGWTGPAKIDGHITEGSWRSHQVPLANARDSDEHLQLLADWLTSYQPEELFDDDGAPAADILALTPPERRRMSGNPHANGGLLTRDLRMPDFRDFAVDVPGPGERIAEPTKELGTWLAEVIRR